MSESGTYELRLTRKFIKDVAIMIHWNLWLRIGSPTVETLDLPGVLVISLNIHAVKALRQESGAKHL